ncbi:MAG: hypothetical protein KDD35_10165 [Bdellovibrionales bacterium]|nr:hypothetical protein [Bdellovibrionales bacterium]
MYHYFQGEPTRQAHKGIPEGKFEEEQGTKGFFGPVSHLIRKNPSTNWVEIEGPLKPRMYDLVELSYDPGMRRLLFNAHIAIYDLRISCENSEEGFARRNADGDLLYFCHSGRGDFFTDYGCLSYEKSQYVMIPKKVLDPFYSTH